MTNQIELEPRLYFSYRQFFVYDSSVQAPGCLWTEIHSAQGFARRESVVSFGTLLEFGYADVSCCQGPFLPNAAYQRIIAVPFFVSTGKIIIDGPEEVNIGRFIKVPTGNYQIVAAQRITGDEEEQIGLCFQKCDKPLSSSKIIKTDALLNPPAHLLETAEIAR